MSSDTGDTAHEGLVAKSLTLYILCVLTSCCFYIGVIVSRRQASVKTALSGDSRPESRTRLTALVRHGVGMVAL
jgi:hypothetical protein